MSNIDKITANEELFTELTPEQGAVVEGGLFIFIDQIQSIKAGADLIGKDDTYMTINGNKIWGDKSFSTGQTRNVNIGTSTLGSFARVELFDKDGFLNRDDRMGGFTAYNTFGSLQRARVRGSGSIYDIYYRAFA